MSWRCGYGHSGRVFDVKISPAGDCLLSASEDGRARVWDLVSETVTQKACVAGHKAEVMRASWKHDQKMIATGSADTTAMIWSLKDEYASECIAVLDGHAEELYCCEWVRDSEHVVTASGSDIMLWDISRQRRIAQAMLRSSSVHKDTPELWRDLSIFSCTQHPSVALLASACSDGNVHVTSLHNDGLQPVTALPTAEALGAATMCSAAAFSADGRLLAVGTCCSAVLVYCTRSWKLLDTLRPDAAAAPPGCALGITSCAWDSQAGKPAVLFTAGAAVERWQPASGARSVMVSRWPSRALLCVDCREINGHDVVVASGEVVQEAAAAASGSALPLAALASSYREHTEGDAGEHGDGGGLFAIGGHETAGRARRKRGRTGAADAGIAFLDSPGEGGAAQHSVPSAEGRAPLELWERSRGV